jgi:hypothetical protein
MLCQRGRGKKRGERKGKKKKKGEERKKKKKKEKRRKRKKKEEKERTGVLASPNAKFTVFQQMLQTIQLSAVNNDARIEALVSPFGQAGTVAQGHQH